MENVVINDLLVLISDYNDFQKQKVIEAYNLAKELHQNVSRDSGEPYINHPLRVAINMVALFNDWESVCAALLHDVIEDTPFTKEEIEENFNSSIANLVDGVTNLDKMKYSDKAKRVLHNNHQIIKSMVNDVRIMYLRLADRLDNMRTLKYKNGIDKRKAKAIETLDIFVPITYRLGLYNLKNELEDLSLMYIDAEGYKKANEMRENHILTYSSTLNEVGMNISFLLNAEKIDNRFESRVKNVYGIYKQIVNGKNLMNIHDLNALRVIVDDITSIYISLGVIHFQYHQYPNSFKDFVTNPKPNYYQSLHTTVFGPNSNLIQFQIRTEEMDNVAKNGFIGVNKGMSRQFLQEKFHFIQSIRDIEMTSEGDKDFIHTYKKELNSECIFVYTPKGDRIELPLNATPIDLAYNLHTDLGNTMIGAIVNGEEVVPTHILQDKDRVEISINKNIEVPREEWLECVVTTVAKKSIREFVYKRDENHSLH